MDITRRHLVAASVLTVGGWSLLRGASAEAQSADEAAVAKAIEALRKATFDQGKSQLEELCAEELSYGHLRWPGRDQGPVHQRCHDPQGDAQIAHAVRSHDRDRRQQRDRATPVGVRERNGWQAHQHADPRPASLAQAGERLEAPRPSGGPASARGSSPTSREQPDEAEPAEHDHREQLEDVQAHGGPGSSVVEQQRDEPPPTVPRVYAKPRISRPSTSTENDEEWQPATRCRRASARATRRVWCAGSGRPASRLIGPTAGRSPAPRPRRRAASWPARRRAGRSRAAAG